MKVIVTGGAGFVGSHVVDRLLQLSHEVIVIDDFSTGREDNLRNACAHGLTEVIRADAAAPNAQEVMALFKPEAIVMLAAQPSVKVSMRDPLRDARQNVVGLVKVLETAVEIGVRKVVFATSGGTMYGDVGDDSLPIVETHRGTPNSFYGLAKQTCTEYLRLYRKHRGLDYTALALGNAYGERQDPNGEAGVVAIFLDRLRRGLPCIVNGVGDTTRDYVHVHDVARAFTSALDRGSGLINIGTGLETSTICVYNTIASHFPNAELPEHRTELQGEVKRVCLDRTRAAERLGWTPTIAFKDGIDELVGNSERVVNK